ncbi:MAG: ABC transporter permease [Hungatella hathewayi]|nr:ABC transporter permease [Hungatella hathewayi]
MAKYILKRFGQMVLVLVIISIFAFSLVHMVPGDPVYTMLGTDITQERHDQVWIEMGLHQPLIQQYISWVGNVLTGNFGYSYTYRSSVMELLSNKLPITLYLGIAAAIISIILGVGLGIVAAINRAKWQDNLLTVLANLGMASPKFWLGIILVYLFSIKLGVANAYGFEYPWVDFTKSMRTTILPILCMSVSGFSSYIRQTRSSMLEVVSQDYVRTARSKGLKESTIIRKHELKNAMIPILTLISITLRNVIAGSAVIESVFNINGMGYLMAKAIQMRDFQVVQTILLLMGVFTCLCNLVIDIAYSYIDPRVKLQ